MIDLFIHFSVWDSLSGALAETDFYLGNLTTAQRKAKKESMQAMRNFATNQCTCRRVSLLVHPDKVSHPRASEAFRRAFDAMQLVLDHPLNVGGDAPGK